MHIPTHSLAKSGFLESQAPGVNKSQPSNKSVKSPEQATEESIIDEAISAWRSGNFSRTRSLLSPYIRDSGTSTNRSDMEIALRYIADAILLDPNLDERRGRQLARAYIERLFDEDPDWTPPHARHGDAFYSLVAQIRAERTTAASADCQAARLSCEADLEEIRADKYTLDQNFNKLQRNFEQQYVVIEEKVARNRLLALLPAGIGHFYSGNKTLAWTFLSIEAAVGAVGLSLALDRKFVLNCERTNGYAPQSLVCDPPDHIKPNEVILRRRLEQSFGLLLIGTAALDILISQLIFVPYETIGTRRIQRSEFEKKNDRHRKKRPLRKRSALRWRPLIRSNGQQTQLGLRLHF